MLVPGLNYAFETFVQCLNDKGISDAIKVRNVRFNDLTLSIVIPYYPY